MIKPLQFESARIGFKNFEGVKTQYNKLGDRNFVVFLEDPEEAAQLAEDGWNVKYPKPNPEINPEDDTRDPYIEIAVSFDPYPPKIVIVRDKGPQYLSDMTVQLLDKAVITNVDMVVKPYEWENPTMGKGYGIKAYLKDMYVTLEERGFEAKYGY